MKRKRIRSRAGWGEALQAGREVRLHEALCLFIRPFEQPVVGLEPDRSDPRMRLKQNWSFRANARGSAIGQSGIGGEAFRSPFPDLMIPEPRFGDESNQVP